MKIKEAWYLLKDAAAEWSDDNVSRLSAALAYYTLVSIAPLLVIVLAIVGYFLGGETGESRVMQQLGSILGQQGTSALQSIAHSARQPTSGLIATVISFVILLLTASGVFYELQTSLDTVWDVQPKTKGIWGIVKSRLPSFSIIPVIGFLLLVSLVVSAGISAFGNYMTNILPGTMYLLHAANFLLSFVIVGLLFALVYKILPDAEIKWSDVWLGAGFTSLLFSIGKFGIGLYLGKSSMSSMYGAAGSLVILLAWVYYAAQIFFFGAEFTQVYANRYGSRVRASSAAEPMPSEKPEAEHHPSRPGDEERPSEGADGRIGRRVGKGLGRPEGVTRQPMRRNRRGPMEEYEAPIAAMEDAQKNRAESPSFVALSGFLGGLITGFFLWRPHKQA